MPIIDQRSRDHSRHPAIRRAAAAVPLALLGLCGAAAPPATAGPPQEGECPAVSAPSSAGGGSVDATPLVLREGMLVDKEGLLALRSLLPPEIWRHREVFFFEGMRMEIGPCHRRYAVPGAYRSATERFAGRTSLDDDGNLFGYLAGLPFRRDQIDPADPQAGLKWAWNFEKRYRGAGHRGSFRVTSFPSRTGSIQRYRGSFFVFRATGRSDLPDSDYATPAAGDKLWTTGGRFSAPFSTRELAWRQFRTQESERRWQEPDDIFVYVPSMRKMRRSASSWVDGAFMPKFTAAGQYAGGGVAFGEQGSINPTAGRSIAVSEDARAGLTGLFLRPNAYHWRLKGEQTVLAPLNASQSGYPENPERNYGYSGLSLASDRWDVRHAVVIEGALRMRGDNISTLTIYLDHQTLQPLYWITRTSRRRLLDVGILAHRFAADVPGYPEWPGGTMANVFEPVAASFYNALAGAGGWLRESYGLSSLPFSRQEQQRMTTADTLQRGH